MPIDSQDIITEQVTHDIVDETIEHSLSEEVVSHIIEAEQWPPWPPWVPWAWADPADFAHTHNQVTAESEWIINHNLWFNPNIQINDSSWDIVLPSRIIHDSVNIVRIQFLWAMSWTAYCS